MKPLYTYLIIEDSIFMMKGIEFHDFQILAKYEFDVLALYYLNIRALCGGKANFFLKSLLIMIEKKKNKGKERNIFIK